MRQPNRKFPIGALVVLGSIALFIGLIAAAKIESSKRFTSLSNRDVALLCTTDMATQFHIHAKLKIVIDGREQTIPQGIGIKPGCMNAIHTHDDSGTIHIEAPEKRDFTLADLFAVWGEPFSKERILDAEADGRHAVTLTVNGAPVDTFENTVMRDDDAIVIAYGEKK